MACCSSGNCMREVRPPYKTCSACRAAVNARRKTKVAGGLCRYCSRPKRPGTNSCDSCAKHRRDYIREVRWKLKKEIMIVYGGRCACCGEAELAFLTVDHVNGGGRRHRMAISKSKNPAGNDFYRWLKNNDFPPGFRVLCFNCNCAIGFYGVCPHSIVSKSGSSTV